MKLSFLFIFFFLINWKSYIYIYFFFFIWKSWIIGTIEVIIQPKRWYIASSFTAWSYLKASGTDGIWELLDLFPLGQRLIIHAWGHSMRFGWHLFIVYHGVTSIYCLSWCYYFLYQEGLIFARRWNLLPIFFIMVLLLPIPREFNFCLQMESFTLSSSLKNLPSQLFLRNPSICLLHWGGTSFVTTSDNSSVGPNKKVKRKICFSYWIQFMKLVVSEHQYFRTN